MIYLVWFIYISFALIIAMLIRKLFSNVFFKRLSYAVFLSFFLSVWFLYPGSDDIAPIFSIYFIDLIQFESFSQMRLLRPFLLFFFLIFIINFFVFRYKTRN